MTVGLKVGDKVISGTVKGVVVAVECCDIHIQGTSAKDPDTVKTYVRDITQVVLDKADDKRFY